MGSANILIGIEGDWECQRTTLDSRRILDTPQIVLVRGKKTATIDLPPQAAMIIRFRELTRAGLTRFQKSLLALLEEVFAV